MKQVRDSAHFLSPGLALAVLVVLSVVAGARSFVAQLHASAVNACGYNISYP